MSQQSKSASNHNSFNLIHSNCFQQDSQKRALEQPELDTEDLERLQKKVKKDEVDISLSTPDEGESTDRSVKSLSSPIYLDKHTKTCLSPDSIDPLIIEKGSEGSKVEIKQIKSGHKFEIIEVSFDHKSSTIIFDVLCGAKENKKIIKRLTREEIVKENPGALLYFYEKNLRFVKSSTFLGEDLAKLNF